VNARTRLRGNACGFTACPNAQLDTMQWCAQHAGFAFNRGIPIDVYTDPSHWARNCPRPVDLAVGNSDACARCARPLNVNEPVFCGPRGAIICAGCNDATAATAVASITVTPPADLRTSELMRRCATLLLELSLPGSLKTLIRAYANELHGRAFEVEKAGDAAAERCNSMHRMGCTCDLLSTIGEARS
jgi:hypothetical protein